MSSLPPDKEISFVFDRDIGFKQVLVPRNESSNGCIVTVNGTLSASAVFGASGSGGGGVGPQGPAGPTGSVGPAGPTGSQGPQGVTGSAGSAPSLASYNGYTLANHFSGSAGTLRGNAAGFTVAALIRPDGFPTDTETFFGNYNRFQAQGGWWMGIDTDRWKLGIGQQSDSTVIENFSTGLQDLTNYYGRFLRRLFLLHFVYDGTTVTLYINGQSVRTLTPSGGYQVADAALIPRIGRNTNAGASAPATTTGFIGGGYVESIFTATDVLNHYFACLEAESFQNASFTNWWTVDTAETNLIDQGASLDFALNGTLTAVDVTARW